MPKTSPNQKKIIQILSQREPLSSSAIQAHMVDDGIDLSLVTVKRALSAMVNTGTLAIEGSGPATVYKVSALGRLFADVDASAYGAMEPDVPLHANWLHAIIA